MRERLVNLWLRLTCPRTHGDVLFSAEELYVGCARCGFVSPGIALDSRAVRLAWRFDRQRARFPRRKAS